MSAGGRSAASVRCRGFRLVRFTRSWQRGRFRLGAQAKLRQGCHLEVALDGSWIEINNGVLQRGLPAYLPVFLPLLQSLGEGRLAHYALAPRFGRYGVCELRRHDNPHRCSQGAVFRRGVRAAALCVRRGGVDLGSMGLAGVSNSDADTQCAPYAYPAQG